MSKTSSTKNGAFGTIYFVKVAIALFKTVTR